MKSIASPQTMHRFSLLKCKPLDDSLPQPSIINELMMNISPSASAQIKKRIGDNERKRSSKLSLPDDGRA
jgi:hypothetical protein